MKALADDNKAQVPKMIREVKKTVEKEENPG